MYKLLLLSIFTLVTINSFAQRKISEEDDDIRGKVIFLNYQDDKLYFFDSKHLPTEGEELEKVHTLSLQDTYVNVYLKWLNPLKYKVTWKDQQFEDERDAIIRDFIASLATQFGSDLNNYSDLTLTGGDAVDVSTSFIKKNSLGDIDLPSIKYARDSFEGKFHDLMLVNLYYEILNMKKSILKSNGEDGGFSKFEFDHLKLLLNELNQLDSMNNVSLSNMMTNEFVNMLKVKKLEGAIDLVKSSNTHLALWKSHFERKQESISRVKGYFDTFEIWKNTRMASYVQSVIASYVNKVQKETSSEKGLFKDIKSCYELLEKSTEQKSNVPEGYIKIRDVNFKEGKEIQTDIEITEINFDVDYKLDGEQVVYSSTIKIRKSDIIVPSVSAGIFYSNSQVIDYGVSNDGAGSLEVSEENYRDNMALTASFLNLNFDVRSRYFSPLIQIGIDPTKERPFMLFGTGFSIPAFHFSITGGAVWTWQKSLTDLNTGATVGSSAELERDLDYNFNYVPLGGYIGIQWNF